MAIFKNPADLLKALIRFDTSNPPGNEKECILFIKKIFDKNGFETSLYAQNERRPNLIARLKGRGSAPPFLMYGHVDVVPAKDDGWKYPPFEGALADDYLWGRGALDMKGGIAMMISALLRTKEEGVKPSGDIIFSALSDEESGGNAGAKYLVENHPGQFEHVKYAIGEFGGFPVFVGKKRLYLIQIGEKQICWIKGKVTGRSGHAAHRIKDSAAAKLGRMLSTLGKKRLSVHIPKITRDMVTAMADNLPLHQAFFLKFLLNPLFTNLCIDMLGERGDLFDPLFHHNANVTIINGGEKINVVPSEIHFQIDGRILPGYQPDDLISEIKHLTKVDMDLEVARYEPCSSEIDLTHFEMLADILREKDPGCIPIPFLMPAMTGARFFSRLGIQTYGFTPMNLPKGFEFAKLVHSENERIPVRCLEFGTQAIFSLIQRLNG
ncbi:MAG: M20/M25/M40 family metallo-hydrolase [Proteobacteria bacterium]|nr:M20/M25/M40 family metallo-hydrolase [Pseudomonadota bacterium]